MTTGNLVSYAACPIHDQWDLNLADTRDIEVSGKELIITRISFRPPNVGDLLCYVKRIICQ